MRIALIAEDYYPQLGGVPEHVHHLALQLNAWGHDTTVITSRMRGAHSDAPFVRRVGTSLVVYANGGVSRITLGWRLGRQLEDLFRAGRYDLVHVQGGLVPTFGLLAPLAAWRVGIPVVATFHSWFPRSAGYRVLRRLWQPLLDRHAALIAVSQPVVDAMSRYFHARWEVIPNGVDVQFFQPNGRRPTDALARGPRLLFLARLEPRNGLGTLLEAMPRILERHPRARLTVVGDGPWRGYYERRARRLGAAVRFAGRVLGERPEYYGGADLYLCPTTRSSFGVTLIEAMACGTPIVVSDITGFRELVRRGGEAVLISKDDPAAWAETAIRLIEDPARREAMGAAGLAKAAEFAWPRVAARILGVYERDVPAAFFRVGEHVRRNPAVARRIAERGHELGNHGQHHVKLHLRGPHRIRAELATAHQTIVDATGRAPRVFRAPHGYRNPFVASVVRDLGYRLFGWTFGVWDSDRPGAEEIRRRVRRKLSPGAIILLHDGDGYDPAGDRAQTAAALSGIIEDAREAGYEFRPLAELTA